MNKERCLLKISDLMKRCNILRTGDCENDFDSQRSFRDEVKTFVSNVVANDFTWHQAIDNVSFNGCSVICNCVYDKQESQDAFNRGWNSLYGILDQLKMKMGNVSENDIRWTISYEGGVG